MPEKLSSIKNSIAELDRYEQARALAVDCYRSAIRDFAHYSIELNEDLGTYRNYMAALAERVGEGPPEKLIESRAALRDLLRGVHDKTEKYVADLREQFAATERALGEIMAALASGGSDHDERLRAAVRVLRDLANAPEAGAANNALLALANEIDQSLAALRQQHQVTVSSLKTEIAALHKRIDAMDIGSKGGKAPELSSRSEMERYIRSEAVGGICLIALKVRGLRLAQSHFNREVGLELVGAVTQRLKNILPSGSVVGQWAEEEFLAAVVLPKPEAVKLGKLLTDRLTGMYRCLQEGKVVRPSLQVSSGVIEINEEDTAEETLRRLTTFLTI